MIETIVYIIIALCLVGTVIWAFQRYITIPEPFAWVKGIILFVMIVVACFFIWDSFIAHHIIGHYRSTRY